RERLNRQVGVEVRPIRDRGDAVQIQYATGAAGLKRAELIVTGNLVDVTGHQRQRERAAAADEQAGTIDVAQLGKERRRTGDGNEGGVRRGQAAEVKTGAAADREVAGNQGRELRGR